MESLRDLERVHPRLRSLAIRNYAALLATGVWLAVCVRCESRVVRRAAVVHSIITAYLLFMYGGATASKPSRGSTRSSQALITTMYATWGVLGLMGISGAALRGSDVPGVLMCVVVLCLVGLPVPDDTANTVVADVGRMLRETTAVSGVSLLVSACVEAMGGYAP